MRSYNFGCAMTALAIALAAGPLAAQTATTTTGSDPAAAVPADAAQRAQATGANATTAPAGQANPTAATATEGVAAQSAGLADIVVTATRRDTRLQSTPIAVSAIDSSLIRQASPRNIGDLAAFVPNFSAATIANFNAASFAIRGVGQTSIIVYFEPPVAVLVDDFVVPSVQTQLLDTFDVAQVEVLRGPQGTLFGKNTTGGAVTVRTKRPEMNELSEEVRLQFGSFGTKIFQDAVNVPLVEDKLALRVVGGYQLSDGYYHNGACYGPVISFTGSKFGGTSGCLNGKTLGGTDVANARAKLLFQPDDRFSALLQYEFLRDRSDVVPSVNLDKQYEAAGPFLTQTLGLVDSNPKSSDPLDNAAYTGRHDALLKLDEGQRIDVNGVYLNMDYRTDIGTITSVSGFRSQKSRIPNSYAGATAIAPDGQYLSFFDATRDDNRKTYQEELRFASKFGGPFDFVAGGFYQHDTIDFCVSQILGLEDLVAPPTPYGPWNDTPFILCNAQKSTSKAVFTEGTLKILPRLTLTAGGRYTWEDKTWWGRQQVFIPQLDGGSDPSISIGSALDANVFNYPAGVIQDKEHTAKPTYRASLGYQATPTIFAYFTYSHGFKSGGFNDQIGGGGAFGTDVAAFQEAARATKPEYADSYEGGIKSEFFNHRLRFNVTGFHVDYSDLQKQLNVPITVNGEPNQVTLFVNAASATVNGVEVESSVIPFRGFTLRGVLGYQDAHYDKYTAPGAGYNLADAPLDRAPKWQWTLDGTYETSVFGDYKLTLNADVNYVGRNLDTQSITSEAGNTFLNARTLVNASVTVADPKDRYYVRFVARNLTDKRYLVAIQDVAGLWVNGNYGAPRYFGVELGAKFGR